MNSLAIYALRFPTGTGEPYSFVAVQGCGQMNNLAHTYDEELALLPKIHPKPKIEDFARQTESARKLVCREVCTLLDHAE